MRLGWVRPVATSLQDSEAARWNLLFPTLKRGANEPCAYSARSTIRTERIFKLGRGRFGICDERLPRRGEWRDRRVFRAGSVPVAIIFP